MGLQHMEYAEAFSRYEKLHQKCRMPVFSFFLTHIPGTSHKLSLCDLSYFQEDR